MCNYIVIGWLIIGHFINGFGQTRNEFKITIITEDINRFWNAYDAAKPKFRSAFFNNYIKYGSNGLRDFMPVLKSTKELAKAIKKNKDKYESIRDASLRIEKDERVKIERAFDTLKKLYPNTYYPTIYFVIGQMNIGSSISENGVIIAYETMSIMGNESLLPLILHEAIHFQQNYNSQEESLLGRCIMEGAANLISEIALGENANFNHNNDDYGFSNERELWRQFKKDMKTNNLKNWLFEGNVFGNGPKHMGYWIGYQIVKEYYLKTNNKKQAIREILNIEDFNVFLKGSSYADKFE